MAKSKLEYIWLDGYQPTQNMRSKTKLSDLKLMKRCLDLGKEYIKVNGKPGEISVLHNKEFALKANQST